VSVQKAGQRSGWEQATPRGLTDLVIGHRTLSDEEKLEARRVTVARIEELTRHLRLVESMADNSMKKALVHKHQGLIDGLESFLSRC